ncbi:unnamed protein product [Didymodactylos carnosus]|uniref:Glycoside hydrolase family 38 N-terminal domain-containing protein n=1 Tax=Didymodactylos carnosus TaxID=1234261 RepID=A0A814AK62_9BILA|nr:unnamed protein product [Didymodactylos carnosus]CAF1042949.1 unnamed protein product [Didymodactylos carnosus]CAF3693929.1 unnamed protein product [Didymodactylos carnosus]CAF3811079.1 unnamed protein product [Didymodactylos carnosus]
MLRDARDDVKKFLNDTQLTLVTDQNDHFNGTIYYEQDLPSICWEKDTTSCWKPILSNISRIHVINMNHLDVGYNGIPKIGFINNILNIYFHQYFPRAALLAEQIRKVYPEESFVYTTHPWLLDLFFNCPTNLVLSGIKLICPSDEELALIENSIRSGHITWHAAAMNMQYEFMDELTLNASFDIAVSLSKRFDVPVVCVLSLRDVPGLPISVVQAFKAYFQQYCTYPPMITVGVNNAVTGLEIPKGLFRWGIDSDSSVLATWHSFGYPNNPGSTFSKPGGLSLKDLLIVPEAGIGLAFAFRTDNQGPPQSLSEIHQNHEILRQSYPSASVFSSSLQSFLEDVSSHSSQLEYFDGDISDTWLQGIGSDPKRVQQYQVLQRAISRCYDQNLCEFDNEQLINASRFLIKIPEHTWGLPGVYDQINWSNEKFHAVVKSNKNYNNCRLAWTEQREFFNLYLQTVENHPLYDIIQEELTHVFTNLKRPNLENFQEINPNEDYFLFKTSSEPFHVSFDDQYGSIKRFYRDDKIYWTTDKYQLASYVYITYNQTDFDHLSHTYGIPAFPGISKPNSTVNAHPQSAVWLTQVQKFYRSKLDENQFLTQMLLDQETTVNYGGFGEIWLNYTFLDETTLLLEWLGLNKTSTRLGEASMIKFMLPMSPTCTLILYDNEIDVQKPAKNSSFYQRGVHAFKDIDESIIFSVHFSCKTSISDDCYVTLKVTTLDAPIACPIVQNQQPTALPFPAPGDDDQLPLDGMAINLHNNVWETNYIFWYPFEDDDQSWRARFLIKFDGSCV